MSVPDYYTLNHSKQGLWSKYVSGPFRILPWVIPSFITRSIVKIALGPDEIKPQNLIHVLFLTDDRMEKGKVIVNLLPSNSNKEMKGYFDKMPWLPFKAKRKELFLENPKHKSHIDAVINDIGLLLAGKSNQEKCKNKKFIKEEIYLKGMERLDRGLRSYFKEKIHEKYGMDFSKQARALNLNFFTLKTPDKALLESVQLSIQDEELKPISERKFIITCMARNQNYMFWLKDFYTSAKNIGCTVIGFNYRGIDYSKGFVTTYHDMVNDALAQAQRLLELGVKPENIAFEGMSLGGAVATISAAKMHDKGFKVTLYNERSYRSLIRLVVGFVMPASNCNLWNPINWSRYLVAGLSYITLGPAIRLVGWHMDAASAWDRIPLRYKFYSVAHNHQNPDHYDDDEMVHDSFASIASLMAEHKEKIKLKKKNHEPLSRVEKQLLADDAESHEFTLDRTNKINTNPLNHAAPRRFLFDTKTHSNTLQDYMIRNFRLKLGTHLNLPEQSAIPSQGLSLG